MRYQSLDAEFSYFSLAELAEISGPFGLRVERDTWFKPCKVANIPRW